MLALWNLACFNILIQNGYAIVVKFLLFWISLWVHFRHLFIYFTNLLLTDKALKDFMYFNWFLMFFYAWWITTNDIHVIYLGSGGLRTVSKLWKEDVIILFPRPEIRATYMFIRGWLPPAQRTCTVGWNQNTKFITI